MFAWGDNWKEDVKDCFPQSSFLVARAEGSLGCLLPERRQTSAFCVRVDSQGLLLRDGGGCGSQSLASQPRQEPLVSAGARQPRDSRVSLGRGAASLDFCHSPPPTPPHHYWVTPNGAGVADTDREPDRTGWSQHLGHKICRPQLREGLWP